MTWTAQALHVARKDVRYARVALIVYSVIVAAALIHAVRLPVASRAVFGAIEPASAAMFVLVLLGVILAATAVQADSPSRATLSGRVALSLRRQSLGQNSSTARSCCSVFRCSPRRLA